MAPLLDQHGHSVVFPPGHDASMYAGSAGFVYVPLTLLDTRETNDRETPRALYRRLKALPEGSIAFRHGRYHWHRQRVLDAFARLGIDDIRQRAYASCGSGAWLMQSETDQNVFSVRSDTCRDRWCPACAGTRASVIRSNLQPLTEKGPVRLITLTLKHKPDNLTNRLLFLVSRFAILRKLKVWKDAIEGGAAFIEVKMNTQTREWHPHLHILAVGKYIPQQQLRDAWLACTGDSYIVDIRLVRDPEKIAQYVTKYVTKPADNDLYRDPDALAQAILAMKGKRLAYTFGTWRKVALLQTNPEHEWRPVLDWQEFMDRVKAGNQWCIRALAAITPYEHDANDPNPHNGQAMLDWDP